MRVRPYRRLHWPGPIIPIRPSRTDKIKRKEKKKIVTKRGSIGFFAEGILLVGPVNPVCFLRYYYYYYYTVCRSCSLPGHRKAIELVLSIVTRLYYYNIFVVLYCARFLSRDRNYSFRGRTSARAFGRPGSSGPEGSGLCGGNFETRAI